MDDAKHTFPTVDVPDKGTFVIIISMSRDYFNCSPPVI